MKPYESYKKTDIPWLDEVPSHWDFLRNKNVMTEKKDVVGSESSKYTLLSLTLNGVVKRDMENAKGKFPKDFDTYKIVSGGEMIFCLFDVDETPRTVGLSNFNGMITGAYDVFSISNINSKYLYYYYLSVDMAKAMKPLYTGLRKVIGVPKFLGTKLPSPPHTEQDQIVRYLDWQISKINKLVQTKKRQIELLKEQKQAVINKAVTKGLDDSVPMEDSGYYWSKNIPKSWAVIQLKKLLKTPMSDGPHETPTFFDYGVPFVSAEAAHDGRIFLSDCRGFISQEQHEIYCKKVKPEKNDIFIVKSGSTTGKAVLVDIDEEFSIWSPLALVRCNNRINYKLAYYAIISDYFQQQVRDNWSFGTQPNIGMGVLKNLSLLVPPLEEQQAIVDYITDITGKIDTVIKETEQEIELLSEYKTSLISSVVTGKVDVRDVIVPEFEVVEEVGKDVAVPEFERAEEVGKDVENDEEEI